MPAATACIQTNTFVRHQHKDSQTPLRRRITTQVVIATQTHQKGMLPASCRRISTGPQRLVLPRALSFLPAAVPPSTYPSSIKTNSH